MSKTTHFQNRLVVQAIHQNWLTGLRKPSIIRVVSVLKTNICWHKVCIQIKALQLKTLKNKNNIIDYPLWPLSSYVDTWSSISDHLNHVIDSLFLYNLTAVPKALMTQMCCSTKSGYKNKYAFSESHGLEKPLYGNTNGYWKFWFYF